MVHLGNLILRNIKKMEITSLVMINWVLTDLILVELTLITTTFIKRISKNKFWYILLSSISIILLIIALSYGIASALGIEKNATDLVLTGGFY
jgi:hypothetical protein